MNELETGTVVQAVQKEHGHVKWFNPAKGYGFIQRQDGQEIFVHFSGIVADGYKSLNDGDPVEFEVKSGPKGAYAENVVVSLPASAD